MTIRSAHASRVILGRGFFISTSSRLGLKESSMGAYRSLLLHLSLSGPHLTKKC